MTEQTPHPNSLPGTSSPSIGLIRREDLPNLLAFYRFLHAVDAPLPDSAALCVPWDSILSDPRLFYVVAQRAGDLVATCNLVVVPNLTRGARPYGVIENVVTHAHLWCERGHVLVTLDWYKCRYGGRLPLERTSRASPRSAPQPCHRSEKE